ncbi:MAG TPA: hypothetical protein VFP55_06025 [Solirubrobacteraceae bacterium]|nr:hypothetical protein [Solirubrobacteraceae bacterium]
MRIDQVDGAMQKEVPLGSEAMLKGPSAETRRPKLLAMSACVLDRAQACDLSWQRSSNLFQRACCAKQSRRSRQTMYFML